MADPEAYFGQGIELRIYNGATYDPIPGCMSFSGPGKTRDTVDVTSHSSTGGYRTFITGLRDGGEVSFDLNWLFGDTAQDLLETAFADNDPVSFEMAFPMAAADNLLTFDGLVTDMTWNGPIDAQVTRSVTIKVTGPITVGTD